MHNPVQKGSGIWGKELGSGSLVLLESIRIEEAYRRQGLGSFMLDLVLQATQPGQAAEDADWIYGKQHRRDRLLMLIQFLFSKPGLHRKDVTMQNLLQTSKTRKLV